MFADTQISNLFPTPLWILDLADPVPMNAALTRAIADLLTPRPQVPIGTSLQTDPVLHTLPAFADFAKATAEAVNAALASMHVKHAGWGFSGMWANINPTGAKNTPHTHPNNFLSGVYYVVTPGTSGRIQFQDPRPQAGVMMPPTAQPSPYVSNEVTVEAKPGRFVLFPGWLVHGVPTNTTEQDRISISFNVMFDRFAETMAAPLWAGRATAKIGKTTPP